MGIKLQSLKLGVQHASPALPWSGGDRWQ